MHTFWELENFADIIRLSGELASILICLNLKFFFPKLKNVAQKMEYVQDN